MIFLNLKTGCVPYFGLVLTMNVIKNQIHRVRQFLYRPFNSVRMRSFVDAIGNLLCDNEKRQERTCGKTSNKTDAISYSAEWARQTSFNSSLKWGEKTFFSHLGSCTWRLGWPKKIRLKSHYTRLVQYLWNCVWFREQLAKETGLSMRVIQVGLKIIMPLTIRLIRYNSVYFTMQLLLEIKEGDKVKRRH